MRVIHLSNGINGGAGRAAYILHSELISNGIQSYMLCGEFNESNDFIKLNIINRISLKLCALYSKISRRLSSLLLNSKPAFLGLFTPRNIVMEDTLYKIFENTDIVVIHWISEFISISSLDKVFNDLPSEKRPMVIFSNFDMAHYTGGCHFSFGCTGYKYGCDECPYTNSFYLQRLIANNNLIKSMFISNYRASAVSFSEYTTHQSRVSSMSFSKSEKYNFPIRQAMDKKERNKKNKGIVNLFLGAFNKSDYRKGYNRSILVFNKLKLLDPKLFCMLNVHIPKGEKGHLVDIGMNIVEYDYMSSEKEIMKYLEECDVYFNATYDEQGPTMLLMAALSGTSYFSSAVGMSKELVEDGYSGCIIDDWNIDEVTRKFRDYLINIEINKPIANRRSEHIKFSDIVKNSTSERLI